MPVRGRALVLTATALPLALAPLSPATAEGGPVPRAAEGVAQAPVSEPGAQTERTEAAGEDGPAPGPGGAEGAERSERPEGTEQGDQAPSPGTAEPGERAEAADQGEATGPALRDSAPEDFHIGSAVAGGGHHEAEPYPDPFTHDEGYTRILGQEFNSLAPENQMKWSELRPSEDEYDFTVADAIMDFAERNDQAVRGHTLLWHDQNPQWLEEGDHSEDELRRILREHITTVVGRYEGRIHQWDVANEVIDDDGLLRTEENFWLRELGPDVLDDVFRWAHEADPQAELFLNDYSVEEVNDKSDAYLELIGRMLDDGVPVHGFGIQAHMTPGAGYPDSLPDNLDRFGDLGLSTAMTEVDVRLEPEGDEPGQELVEEQTDFYAQALRACLDAESCSSFTLWGFTDKYSWVPTTFPEKGWATVMDEDFEPKPAYDALHEVFAEYRG